MFPTLSRSAGALPRRKYAIERIGSVAKITAETNAVFYGFPQTPYLRGSSQDLTFLRLLETEFRNGTLSGERGNASHLVAQDVVGGRDLREATVEWILDADGLGAGVV